MNLATPSWLRSSSNHIPATMEALTTRFPASPSVTSKVSKSQRSAVSDPLGDTRIAFRRRVSGNAAIKASKPLEARASSGSSPGLYSAQQFELTLKNVNWVLEDVRPYLIADGGNVDVVSVDDGVISLELQGACGTCPSSTTTMRMGIERVLKEKFGEAVKEIRQVSNELQTETTVKAVNDHLEILRPAIKNYGGSVEVLSVDGGDCHVKYVGPDSIGSGIKAAIKEKFPDIVNVVFTS